MEVYLIRHTIPLVDKGICYGFTDLKLANTFPAESKVVKGKLLELGGGDSVFYSSPLFRCEQLVQVLSNQTPIFDDRLKELNFGDWEMQRWDDIDRSELDPWMDDFVNRACLNGESYKELNNRVLNFMTDLKKEQHDKVVIVSHGGVIRAILCQLEGRALKDSFDVKVNYGEVIRYEL